MKRKLMKFEDFQRIEQDSLSTAERELLEAEDILARALGTDDLRLHCYGESDVTYQTPEGSFVHANYRLNKSHVIFEGIEELVIDEDSERGESKKMLSDFVENLLDNNDAKASLLFSQYMSLPVTRRTLKEATMASSKQGKTPPWAKKKKTKENSKRDKDSLPPQSVNADKLGKKKSKFDKGRFGKYSEVAQVDDKERLRPATKDAEEKRREKKGLPPKVNPTGLKNKEPKELNPRWKKHSRKIQKHKVNEYARLVENVYDFINYQELGPALKDSYVKADDRGNVTSVSVPRAHQRNEAKILTFNWKTLDHELKYSRNGAKNLQKEANFCRAMADLRRFNAVSDNTALEECLENIVSAFPAVLFLTQDELSRTVAEALEAAGVRNYDDQQCDFMAEGILRMAHHAYADRAKKIISVSQIQPTVECDNCFEAFKEVAEQFYPTLDESEAIKLRVFSDLYKALHEVYKVVERDGDESAKSEIYDYMSDCEAVLSRTTEPDLDLAESIASFLHGIVEANVQFASDTWDVSNDVYTTVSGDHPRMAKLAQVQSSPAQFNTGEKETLPVSDGSGKNLKLSDEMKNSWMNVGGPDTFPDIKNPYVPKPFGDYTMKGEKGVDKDWESGPGMWQSKETWPNLQNPYIPDSPWDKGKYKMKSDDLIEDK